MTFDLGNIQVDNLLTFLTQLSGVPANQPAPSQRSSGKQAVQRINRQCQILTIPQIDDALGDRQSAAISIIGIHPMMIHCSCRENSSVAVRAGLDCGIGHPLNLTPPRQVESAENDTASHAVTDHGDRTA